MILQLTPPGQLPGRGSIGKGQARDGCTLLVISEDDDEAEDVATIGEAVERYGLDRVASLIRDLDR